MARTYAQILTMVRYVLWEGTADEFTDAELLPIIVQGTRYISEFVPRFVDKEVGVEVEARTGTATSTLANNLVDATNAHFLSTDVGKVIYNTTDYTFAKIITYTSTTTVALSNDIMASGEGYKVLNQKCRNQKQIYIGDKLNDIIIDKTPNRIEYPMGSYHNFEQVAEDVIEIKMDTAPTTTYKKAYIDFARYHKLPNLTDWAGALTAGAAAGAVSIALDGLQTSGTILEGTEFEITNVMGIYTTIADATIATNAATLTFVPGLDVAVVEDQVVTFVKSTLTPQLEFILADYVAAQAAFNIAREKIPASTFGDEVNKYQVWGMTKMQKVDGMLRRLQKSLSYRIYPR